jgi:hypothetical protein
MTLAAESPIDTTYQPKALDFANDRPAIFRTGADIALPPHVAEKRFYKLFGSSTDNRTVLVASTGDGWLKGILESVAAFRTFQDGWDGQRSNAPDQKSLDTSEMLVVLLSNHPRSSDLTFSVDSLGRPTFAGRSLGFYMHLTVDDGDHITWLAEKSGVEHFDGDVEFKGRHLPAALVDVLI